MPKKKTSPDLKALPMLPRESISIGGDIGKQKPIAGFVSKTLLERHKHFENCPAFAFEASREGFRSFVERIRDDGPLEHIFVLIGHSSTICWSWISLCMSCRFNADKQERITAHPGAPGATRAGSLPDRSSKPRRTDPHVHSSNQSTLRCDPSRLCAYDERTQSYKGRGRAIGHVAGRLIALIYALLRHDYEMLSHLAPGTDPPEPLLYDPDVHHQHRPGHYHPLKRRSRESRVVQVETEGFSESKGEREPEAHVGGLPSRHTSWNAEQAMPPGPTLDGEARLGTSESDRRWEKIINAEPVTLGESRSADTVKGGIARAPACR